MELYYIREFVALATMKTFTKVGEELNTTTSSVSRHIQALENELGVELVERNPKGISLTEYGKLFLPYARQLTDIDHQCTLRLKDAKQKEKLLLRLGSSPYTVSGLVTGFAKANPDVAFTLTEYAEDLITDMMDVGEFEMGIGERHLIMGRGKRYMFMPFETRYYYAEMRRDHPFAGKESVSPLELADEMIVIEKSSFPTAQGLYELFQSVGAEPRNLIYINSAARMYVVQGLGVGIVLKSEADARDRGTSDLVDIPIKGAEAREIGIFYLTKMRLSIPAQKMVNYVLNMQAE